MSVLEITTESPEQTQAVGHALAAHLTSGTIVALHGNLAAGKTCFTHGVAEFFGVTEPVSSPTFTLVNEYPGSLTVFHLDLYRLTSAAEIYDLGYEEILEPQDAVCLIEWAERAEGVLPKNHVTVTLNHAGNDTRTISVDDGGILTDGWQDAIISATA
jgi:tRNA threonylcarbamoyladenosine biosynthesis protein TsaE